MPKVKCVTVTMAVVKAKVGDDNMISGPKATDLSTCSISLVQRSR